jgi:hypothetical protein
MTMSPVPKASCFSHAYGVLLDIHLFFLLISYVMTGVLAVVWWFYRDRIVRSDQCLRHVEKHLSALAKDLQEWRLQSTADRGELKGRLIQVEGKIDVALAKLQQYDRDFKDVLPRIAVLEEEFVVKRSN